ncbi:MAG: twin-arginine translocation signal domain-containing protein, partial [Planctomycetes bacterium]|nr:twin-arginine translocation signal domain-containing protein [Planctomycetota bacterium]
MLEYWGDDGMEAALSHHPITPSLPSLPPTTMPTRRQFIKQTASAFCAAGLTRLSEAFQTPPS